MLQRKNPRFARVAFFSVAHGVYFSQFEGLYDTLMGYHWETAELVAGNGVEVVDLGMVCSNREGFETAARINGSRVDLIICNMITYATSSVFAPIVQNTTAPVILLALQPRKALDYTMASTRMQLENDNICSVPEFIGVANRLGRPVKDTVIGYLYGDEKAQAELAQWCEIAKVLHDLKGARIGLMGHVLEAMYDMHADPTAVSKTFGVHVPLLEVDDVLEVYETVTEEEIAAKSALILSEFDTPDPHSDPIAEKLNEKDLYKAAKAAVTLDKFIEKYNLTGLAYYYNGRPGSLHQEVVSSFIVGNSLLNAEGVPMCGEFDIKTCVAMFIMDRLNIGGSFAEFHPIDFKEDYILVGHDGPHHIAIAEGKPVLRSLKKYHGKPGSGASVEFKLKEGPITMLGITQTADGQMKFIIGEGESRKGPIPPTGNTNTRGHFPPNTKNYIKRWVMAGPTHHYALGLGHRADTIAKIAELLNIPYEIVR